MPRQARIDYPGALHHVIGRGIERKKIFEAESDKAAFLERVQMQIKKSSMQCYAWCIMDNHFHLLLQTGKTRLSEFMRRVLTGYAICYNRVNNRTGHLFQNRYKSILCEKDEYLLPLIRYIHLNPVKAGSICLEKLEDYRWTGHREIVEKGKDGEIISKEEVLLYFGKKETEAKKRYTEFIKEGIGEKTNYEGGGLLRSGGGLESVLQRRRAGIREMFDERILGSGEFVEEVLEELEEKSREEVKVGGMEEILEKLSKKYGIKEQEILRSRTQRASEARKILVYMGHVYLGKSLAEMGRELAVSNVAAAKAMRKAEELMDSKQNIIEDILKS